MRIYYLPFLFMGPEMNATPATPLYESMSLVSFEKQKFFIWDKVKILINDIVQFQIVQNVIARSKWLKDWTYSMIIEYNGYPLLKIEECTEEEIEKYFK